VVKHAVLEACSDLGLSLPNQRLNHGPPGSIPLGIKQQRERRCLRCVFLSHFFWMIDSSGLQTAVNGNDDSMIGFFFLLRLRLHPVLLNNFAQLEVVRVAEYVYLQIGPRRIEHIDFGWIDAKTTCLTEADEQIPFSRSLKIVAGQETEHRLICPVRSRAIPPGTQIRKSTLVPSFSGHNR